MKRLLIIIIVLTGLYGKAFPQETRMWVTGTLRIWSAGLNEERESTMTLLPEFGYHLNDSWSIGSQLGFDIDRTTINENTRKVTRTMVIPFVRYFVGSLGKLDFFAQTELPIIFYNGEDFNEVPLPSFTSVGVNLRPGLYFPLVRGWGLTMQMPAIFKFERHNNYSMIELGINDGGYTIQRYLLSTAVGLTYSF
jgi:hypothetical protein